jgi:hypothetical protein
MKESVKVGSDGIEYFKLDDSWVSSTHQRLLYLKRENKDYSVITESEYIPEIKQWAVKATVIVGGVKYTGQATESIEDKEWGSVALQSAETKAVGRALGFAGIGIEFGFASLQEMDKVKTNIEKSEKVQDELANILVKVTNQVNKTK